ncbi:MAG: tyrosine-type recombinase/integrase, partial [Eubacteriales bacterium]|nr:tyrosine-type recombinase/integrase [Eubacteriales bacterium]
MDYGLMICQANGRPIMTEHLNKRFKDILVAMNGPTISTKDFVFHSIRHTSADLKLRLSKGDLKAVQGDGGWSSPEMVTKKYAHILDEDRKNLAAEMEASFYQENGAARQRAASEAADDQSPISEPAPQIDVVAIAAMLAKDPSLMNQVVQSIPMFSPSLRGQAGHGGAVWADAGTIIPWNLYMNYGDKELLEE